MRDNTFAISDERLMEILNEVSPPAVRIPPGIKAIARAIEKEMEERIAKLDNDARAARNAALNEAIIAADKAAKTWPVDAAPAQVIKSVKTAIDLLRDDACKPSASPLGEME